MLSITALREQKRGATSIKNQSKFARTLLSLALAVIFIFLLNLPSALAISNDDINSVYKNTVWYNPSYSGSATSQCSPGTDTSPPSPAGQNSSVYLIGDSIGTQITSSLASALTSQNRQFRGNAEAGRTLPGGIAAITQNQDFLATAGVVVVELGTNSSGFTAAAVGEMAGKIRDLSPSSTIFWVDTAVIDSYRTSPLASTLSNVNQIIYDQSQQNNYQVLSWNKKVFGANADPTNISPTARDIRGYINSGPSGLGVHLSSPAGIDAMTQMILVGIAGGLSSGTDDLANCACSIPLSGDTNAERIWNYLISKGLTPNQVAGIMGNMRAEAGFEPRRVEYAYSSPPHLSDTVPPNIGPQGQPGYGIVQWTSPGRKQGLRDLSASRGVIAGDLGLQLDYLWQELNGPYADELRDIRASSTLAEASYIFLSRFEVPGDIPGQTPVRERYGQAILDQFGSGSNTGGGGGSCGSEGGGSLGTSPDGFVFPLRTTKATLQRGYNGQRWCYQSQTNCHHDYNAADIIINTGTPVVAVRNGTITNTRSDPARLVLHADNGRSYYYTHMLDGSLTVRDGQEVRAGQQLGVVGDDADGEGIRHLHIDELPRPPYDYRPSCGNAACQAFPFINIQPELLAAYANLP